MAPLLVLITVTVALRVVGAAGVGWLRGWPAALRYGLSAMFIVTGVSHFFGMRGDLIAMVPPPLPQPELLVTLTGILELAGAVGLLLNRTAAWAAGCLAALLVVMFPANIYAALEGIVVSRGPAMAVGPRTLLQLTYLGAALVVLASQRSSRPPATKTTSLRPATRTTQ